MPSRSAERHAGRARGPPAAGFGPPTKIGWPHNIANTTRRPGGAPRGSQPVSPGDGLARRSRSSWALHGPARTRERAAVTTLTTSTKASSNHRKWSNRRLRSGGLSLQNKQTSRAMGITGTPPLAGGTSGICTRFASSSPTTKPLLRATPTVSSRRPISSAMAPRSGVTRHRSKSILRAGAGIVAQAPIHLSQGKYRKSGLWGLRFLWLHQSATASRSHSSAGRSVRSTASGVRRSSRTWLRLRRISSTSRVTVFDNMRSVYLF